MAVKNIIFKDLAQTTANTFTAVVAGNTKDLKVADFSFVNVATKATVAIKEVAVDKKDATKVTVTTFANLTDGKAYAVTLDGTTKEITVTDGKVVSVDVTPTEIPYATLTTIKVVAKDANGVIVAQSADDGTLPDGYALTITTKTGYVTNNDLYLTNKGDTAVAKATKHSYKFDTTGKEIETVESNEVTITAVDPAAVSGFALRLAGTATKFDDAKDGNTMPVGTSKTAFVKITDANGKEVSTATYSGYTVSSSDASVLQVSGTLAGQNSPITLVSIKTGTAYVLVKDAKGNVVASLPIVIQDAAKPVTLALNKTAVVLSNAAAIDEKAVITASAKDQYGADYTIDSDVIVKCNATTAKNVAVDTVNANASSKFFTIVNGTVTFNGNDLVKGSYIYEIKYTKGNDTTNSVFVTVEVKDPTDSTATDYAFAGDVDSFDTTISDTNKTTKKIAFNLYELKGGVKNNLVANSNVKYSVKKDGKDVTTTKATAEDVAGIFENSDTITVVALGVDSSNVATKLEAGVYTITATYKDSDNKTYTRVATLTITDKQPALTAKVVKDNVSKTKASSGESLVKEAVEFYYNGTKIDLPVVADIEGVCVGADVKTASSLKATDLSTKGYVVTFTKAKIKVTVAGSVTYDMTVAIPNGVVTITD